MNVDKWFDPATNRRGNSYLNIWSCADDHPGILPGLIKVPFQGTYLGYFVVELQGCISQCREAPNVTEGWHLRCPCSIFAFVQTHNILPHLFSGTLGIHS